MKPMVAALAAVLLVAVAVIWWRNERTPVPESWQGYAEADYVKVGPTQEGLLTGVAVARGDEVAVGSPLFTQDAAADRDARDQAVAQLAQAERQLANFQAGGKPTEIDQAQANLADAQATLTEAGADLKRGQALVHGGTISVQTLDQLRTAYQSAEAHVHALTAALAEIQAPLGRDQEIAGAEAAVTAARAALAGTEWRLAQRSVTAPVAGRVADTLALAGETVMAGAPVVSLLPPGNIRVRFFVPEAELATIHAGESVALSCDNCPADLVAAISFISPEAEYTPPVIYSESSRSKLVFMIEARPKPDQAASLNPGEPVEVRPLASGPAR